MKMKLTVTEVSVHQAGVSPIFANFATKVRLEDEGAGEFIVLSQCSDEKGLQEIRFDFDELDSIVKAVKILKSGIEND